MSSVPSERWNQRRTLGASRTRCRTGAPARAQVEEHGEGHRAMMTVERVGSDASRIVDGVY